MCVPNFKALRQILTATALKRHRGGVALPDTPLAGKYQRSHWIISKNGPIKFTKLISKLEYKLMDNKLNKTIQLYPYAILEYLIDSR